MADKVKTILTTRPFQPLFIAMDDLLEMARPLHEEIAGYDDDSLHLLDQAVWQREKSTSLGSFVMGMAALESFVLNVWHDFAVRQPKDLNTDFFGGRKRRKDWARPRSFEDFRFTERVYLLPALCTKKPTPPAKFFNKNTRNWRRLHELVTIRNRFVHALPVNYKHEITIAPDKFRMIDKSSPDNFWPVTKIAKDVRIFDYQSARLARNIVIWAKDSIADWMPDKLTHDYLDHEMMSIG